MTRRERLERKLALRREWAEKRAAKAAAAFKQSRDMVSAIPMGQPILIGHHSEKRHRALLAKIDRKMRAGVESSTMAEHHEQCADGIERQLASSTFSDDQDAIEQLQERIAAMEADRGRIKAYNASCRKGSPDESLLDESQRKDLATIRAVAFYQLGKRGEMPAYALSNLGANIRRLQQRIEHIKARQERSAAAEMAIGGVLIEGDEWVRVTFAEKPDRSILNDLKAAGFRWGSGAWHGERAKLPQSVVAMTGEPEDPARDIEGPDGLTDRERERAGEEDDRETVGEGDAHYSHLPYCDKCKLHHDPREAC